MSTPKHRLAFEIAEMLHKHFGPPLGNRVTGKPFDIEEAWPVIESMIPSVRAEAYAELDWVDEEYPVPPQEPTQPSRLHRIRELVGATPEMKLGTVLDAVIEELEQARQTRVPEGDQ